MNQLRLEIAKGICKGTIDKSKAVTLLFFLEAPFLIPPKDRKLHLPLCDFLLPYIRQQGRKWPFESPQLEFITRLHQIADALTSILSIEEQEILLKELNKKNSDDHLTRKFFRGTLTA